MKAKKIFLTVLAVSPLLMSCSNDELANGNEPEVAVTGGHKVTMTVDRATDASTKVTYTKDESSTTMAWASGDALSVLYEGGEPEKFAITDGIGTTSGKFENENSQLDGTTDVDILYPYVAATDGALVYDLSEQEGTLAALGKYDVMRFAGVYSNGNIASKSCSREAVILRLSKGVAFFGSNFSGDYNLVLSGENVRSKATYEQGQDVVLAADSVVTVPITLEKGALTDDVYLAFFNDADADVKMSLTVDGFVFYIARASLANGKMYKMGALPYQYRVLTFEDADFVGDLSNIEYKPEGMTATNYWTSLIDDKQYGGTQLYGDMSSALPYAWYDDNNTYLYSDLPENYNTKCFYGGGHAISNYVESDLSNGDYQHQLAVYVGEGVTNGGHNESKNFCTHFGYIDGSKWNMTENLPQLLFYDGVARVIDHMWIQPNAYGLNCWYNGNSLTSKLTDDDYIKVIAEGFDAEGNSVGKVEKHLTDCVDSTTGSVTWQKWDLSALGEVLYVELNIIGTSDNGYGFSQPAYFCFDDVAVRFLTK